MCTCSRTGGVSRREALKSVAGAAAALALANLPLGWASAAEIGGKTRKVLFFTRSQGFEHDVIRRKSAGELSFAEKMMVDLGKQNGFEVTATKDGSVFTPEGLEQFDVIAFYTTGDLEKPNDPGRNDFSKPMPAGGKDALLKAIAGGKGFLGLHCASDTFHSKGSEVDPYIKMLGGEFEFHGSQQKAKLFAVDKNFAAIPGLEDFEMTEEWYVLKNINHAMHVLLMQGTKTMSEDRYKQHEAYPETWARMEGKGRVFYSSMGHREDVWQNPIFQKVLLGGLNWTAGNVQADATPNMREGKGDTK